MRIRMLIVSLLLLTAVAFGDDWNKNYTVGNMPKLSVDTNDARVEVHAAAQNTISVRVTAEGYKIGSSDVRITEHQNGDSVAVQVHVPDIHFIFFGWGNRNVRIDVTVPQNTSLNIHSGDGSLHVFGTKAPAELGTSDGSIEVHDFDGSLHARTSDGSVRVDGRFDDLQLRTTDGSIHCEARAGSQMRTDWMVRSGDGSVSLRLPEGFDAALEAATGDGHITLEVPVSTSGTTERSRVRGTMGKGGRLLEIHTGDGSIRIGRS